VGGIADLHLPQYVEHFRIGDGTLADDLPDACCEEAHTASARQQIIAEKTQLGGGGFVCCTSLRSSGVAASAYFSNADTFTIVETRMGFCDG